MDACSARRLFNDIGKLMSSCDVGDFNFFAIPDHMGRATSGGNGLVSGKDDRWLGLRRLGLILFHFAANVRVC